ncbi:MAG: Holliday junction resolvase-like protein [Bryobacteraceae bacterium]|jgi:predicted Holliday junction resolvase-like endonuclease
MPNPSKLFIEELKRNKRFMGTCPECGQDFRLADAVLFSLDDDAPSAALAAIEQARERIKDRKRELADQRERMTKRAQNTAAAVNLGKIVENIVPSFASFNYAPGDCRALFHPIDYLVFSGLTKVHRVEALSFIDVKSGGARLTRNQRNIKTIVESGKVTFETTRS